jgi:O-antigen ligase
MEKRGLLGSPIKTFIYLFLISASVVFLVTPYPYLALLSPLAIIFLIIAGKKNEFLFYLIILTIPYYRYRVPLPRYPFIKIDYILAFFLFLLLTTKIIQEKQLPVTVKSNLWPWFFIFFLINVISALYSKYPQTSLDGLRFLSVAILFIALDLIYITRDGFIRTLPAVLVVSVGISAFITAIGYFLKIPGFISEIGQGYRGFGPTIGANNMALMCIFTIPLLIHFYLFRHGFFYRSIILLALFTMLMGIITTFSRGGFLNLVVISIIIFFENMWHIKPKNFGLFMGGVGILLIVILLMLPGTYFQRQQTLARGKQADTSLARRSAYLVVGVQAFKKHPFLGTGPYTFQDIWVNSITTRRFKMEKRPAHNTYMDVLVGSGLLGLTAFLILLGRALINYTKAKKLCLNRGDIEMASLIGAYRISFISVLLYLLVKSGLQHKYLLLALALSEIALRIAKKDET